MTIEPATTPAARRPRLPAPIRAMRPRQWIKNVLVFAAPLAAGQLLAVPVLIASARAFVAFSLISAAIYLVNDVLDVDSDRQHPTKRLRPIAAGEFSPTGALVLAAGCAAASLAIGWTTAPLLSVVLGVYAVLQVGYSLFLKHQPIVDLAVVAAGFLLRAVAGGVASGIVLSQWFLLVASFGSLFMVAGKRYSEMVRLGPDAGTRASLERYTPTYLRFVWTLAAALVVMSYSLWAFDLRTPAGAGHLWGIPWAQVTIAPFALAMLRYAYEIDRGEADAPEDVVLSDRMIQVLGVLWLVPLALAVFR
jgi:decaprenyl-phosphate phosphoribosyltransferase